MQWGIADAEYVKEKMVIFHRELEMIVLSLLIVISIWDLLKKEIPIVLLVMFSMASVMQMLAGSKIEMLTTCLLTAVLVGIGIVLVKKGKMGGGDIWVLICLALAWPFELFWQRVMTGNLMLCMTALGIYFLTKDENVQIPMVPFLLLGYWM